MFRKDYIQNKIDPNHSPGFFNILTERIVLEISRMTFRQDHAAVIGLNGSSCGNAGHDRFGAAGISGI